jgi:hypothetical protein
VPEQKDQPDNKPQLHAKDFLEYDIKTGFFYVKRSTPRRLLPNEDNNLEFYIQGKRFKVKASRIAWELGNNQELPDGKQVLHKNLDKQDLRLCNLCVVTQKEMHKIKEAHRNLSGELKMKPHPSDQFSYVVSWIENKQRHSRVVTDVVPAKKLFIKLQLRFAKVLGKYLVLD